MGCPCCQTTNEFLPNPVCPRSSASQPNENESACPHGGLHHAPGGRLRPLAVLQSFREGFPFFFLREIRDACSKSLLVGSSRWPWAPHLGRARGRCWGRSGTPSWTRRGWPRRPASAARGSPSSSRGSRPGPNGALIPDGHLGPRDAPGFQPPQVDIERCGRCRAGKVGIPKKFKVNPALHNEMACGLPAKCHGFEVARKCGTTPRERGSKSQVCFSLH